MFTIGQVVQEKQPEIFFVLEQLYKITFVFVQEEELTPEQQQLDKLMREKPRPGKGVIL